MQSTKEIEVVLRNPLDIDQTLSYYIDVYENCLTDKWLSALDINLRYNHHLEKNFCFLGWATSPRNVDFLCREINLATAQINRFNQQGVWQEHGLDGYEIHQTFTPDSVLYKGDVGKGKPGLRINHYAMNDLHRYFEDLQGEAWGISDYYNYADYETKYAIRQLNILCHELESWALTNRKTHYEPEWQRPSQITTFLNAPRIELEEQDYELFLENRYDREFGGVYLHWAQIGKTHYEVFRDEGAPVLDETTCSAINSLQFYSGEFDVEWGQTVTGEKHEWHQQEQLEFKSWLEQNGLDYNDPSLALGHIKLGQINFEKSFGTEDFFEILNTVGQHLDIYKIKTPGAENTFDYVWSDPRYKQMQIDFMTPGYDWSLANA